MVHSVSHLRLHLIQQLAMINFPMAQRQQLLALGAFPNKAECAESGSICPRPAACVLHDQQAKFALE